MRCQIEHEDVHAIIGIVGPRMWGRAEGSGVAKAACNHLNRIAMPICVLRVDDRYVFVPQHFVGGGCLLVFFGQVEPQLKQLQRIVMLGRQQWKHLRVLHARTRGEPLHITFAIAATGSARIKMVGIALFHYGHGFKTCVRMGRKAWHGVTVVHAKWCLGLKILSPIHRAIDGNRRHVGIARRIGIKMVARKQKWVF